MPLCACLPLLVAADEISHLEHAISAVAGRVLEPARVFVTMQYRPSVRSRQARRRKNVLKLRGNERARVFAHLLL